MKESSLELRFLIISLSNIGDVVLTTPIMSALKQIFPHSFLRVVVGPKAKSLLEGSSMIDDVIVYDKHGSWAEKKDFVLRLRKEKYEAVIDLRNTAIPFLLRSKKRSPLFRKYVGGGMRKKHLDVFGRTGFFVKEPISSFDFFSDSEKNNAFEKINKQKNLSKKYIVFSAGSASEAKRWPLEKFKGLAGKILKTTDNDIVLIGDQNEQPYVQELCEIDLDRIVNVAGILSLRESAAVISDSGMLITNDSAAMHIGHELNKNVIALFGPSDAEKYGRVGPRFKLIKSNPEQGQNFFDDISVEDVYKNVESFFNQESLEVPL